MCNELYGDRSGLRRYGEGHSFIGVGQVLGIKKHMLKLSNIHNLITGEFMSDHNYVSVYGLKDNISNGCIIIFDALIYKYTREVCYHVKQDYGIDVRLLSCIFPCVNVCYDCKNKLYYEDNTIWVVSKIRLISEVRYCGLSEYIGFLAQK